MQRHESRVRWAVMSLVLGVALAACGGPLRYSLHGTPKAPDADAQVEADVSSAAGMTRLKMKVDHLAPPDRLRADGTTYVVWARKNDDAQWQRVGALVYDADGRSGELADSSVPLTSFQLIVSVETQSTPAAPSADVVISHKIEE